MMLLRNWPRWLFLTRRKNRQSAVRRRYRHQLSPSLDFAQILEDRTLLEATIVPLDPTLDQLGFQPAVVQAFDDVDTPEQEQWVAFGIFDTGASVVTLSAVDGFFFEPPFPIKVAGGAEAEGIGGILTGDVSEPVTVIVDGLGASTLEFEEILPGVLFPNFSFDLSDAVDIVPGIQVFVGTLGDTGNAGSESLPTIAGTPMLYPTASNPNGLAALFEPEGELLDLTDFAPGFVLPVPDVEFREPGSDLTASFQVSDSGTVNDASATSTVFVGDEALLDIDDIYVGFTLRFVNGTLSGQSSVITDYDGATRRLTVESGLSAAPGDGDAFEIVRFSSEPIEIDLELIGEDFINHPNPGDEVTVAPLPVHNGVSLSYNGTSITNQNFLFDTGAMLSTITTEMRDQLGLDPNNPDATIDVGGAAGTVASIPGYVIDEFTVPTSDGGTLTFTDVWVFVLDVSTEIGGIWGMNMFNPAAQFLYDPFDPDGTPSLQVSFFEDRINQPLPGLDDSQLDALFSLPFAGSIGFGMPNLPGFQLDVEDVIQPTVAIARGGASPTNADSVVFDVVFSEAVANVDASDFVLAATGNATASEMLNVGNAGDADDATYRVTVLSIAGDGTLGLSLATDTDVQDLAGNSVEQTPTSNENYTIDNTAPAAPVITMVDDDTGTPADGITSDATLFISGTSEADARVELSQTGTGVIGTTMADGAGNWGFDFTGTALPEGTHTLTATATDAAGNTSNASAMFAVTVIDEPSFLMTAAGGRVRVTDAATNDLIFNIEPFIGFQGAVRVAVGDINNDGTPDMITAAGPGGGPHVKVIDGTDGTTELMSFFAFDARFLGGVFVAAEDFDGDDRADIVVAAGRGGGPHVRVFSGANGAELFGFFAYGSAFSGGVQVAAGDITGDGTPDIITAAGPGGGPHVRVFDGKTRLQASGDIGSFFPYNTEFTGGVFVSAGDVNGDDRIDIITGPGAGGGPHVRVFDGASGTQLPGITGSFLAYNPAFTGGVRVAAADVNNDGQADIVTTVGPGGGPHLRVFSGASDDQMLDELRSEFVEDDSFAGGVFVAGSVDATGRSQAPAVRLAEGFHAHAEAKPLALSSAEPVFEAALARLGSLGASTQVVDSLRHLRLNVAPLNGDRLAEAFQGSITLDVNAAGIGWFIDQTPDVDEEFSADGVAIDPSAFGRVDLLTTILHEVGHHLGGADLDVEQHPDHFLADSLAPGKRRLPTPNQLDDLFAEDDLLGLVLS